MNIMKDKAQIIVRIYILLNLFVWVFPNFKSVDLIGSQWLYLCLLNVLGLGLVYRFRDVENIHRIIKNPITICFTLLGIWASMSFLYAGNNSEVFIESGRLFTLIILLVNLSYALFIEKDRMRMIRNIMVIYLGIEILYVLIPTYITHGTFQALSRGQIFKGIAANINITAFSILLKVPFVFSLLKKQESKFLKIALFFLLSSSFFTISLLGTRGALLASFLIVIMSTVFSLVFLKNRKNLIPIGIVIVSLIVPILFNQLIQINNQNDVVNRLGTFRNYSKDGSINERLSYYKLSIENLMENPLIGMGYGNWKIESIPSTLDQKNTYIVPYHSHNDFLQLGAELGLIGLLLYVSIFGFAFYMLYKLFKFKAIDKYHLEAIVLFFVVYLIDANLNFPISRVIIQLILILILSFLIVEYSKISTTSLRIPFIKNAWILFLLLSPFLIYSNYRVFRSFQQQTKLLADFNSRQFTGDINEIGSFEMEYPNIGVTALPLKAMVANYYSVIDPEKAIQLALKSSEDNPYIYLGEVLASRIYSAQGDLVNAKKFSKKAYENAPTIEIHAATYLPFLRIEKDVVELEKISELLKKSKSKYIWELYFLSLFNSKSAMSDLDKELLEIGANRFPEFKKLIDFNSMKDYSKEELEKANALAKKASDAYVEKNFLIAAEKYIQALSVIPTEKAYVENVAKSYMGGKKYDIAISYFNKLITEFGDTSGMPEYYIGVMLFAQNRVDKSCEILLKSIQKKFSSARPFYNSICLKN
jgi:O-antigen ligase